MAKRKEEQWVFDASERTVKLPGHIELHDLLMIVNATTNTIIMNQFVTGKGITARSHAHLDDDVDPDFPYSIDGTCTFTLEFDTTAMSDDDELSIYIDDDRNGLKVRPFGFGTDSIERMRVSNPQSLIDADFEYGLQATKWQNLGLNLNTPSFYESVGQGLIVTDISSAGTAAYSTITVTVEGNAPAVGSPVSVSGTTNSLAEGLSIVLTSNGSTSFTYLAKGSIASGSIYTPYVSVREGGIYSGSEKTLSSMTGGGSNRLVTVVFTTAHGLVPGSPITVSDSTASTQSHEGNFFVMQVVNETTIIYDAGQTVTSGAISITNIKFYARNDSFFTHRPFDGGVLMGTFLSTHGLEAKRQTKRYFRYQSGKGFFFSTGTLFSPVFDIQSATYSAPDIIITTQIPHALQIGAGVKIFGVTSPNYDGFYLVKGIDSPTVFRVAANAVPAASTAILEPQPRVGVSTWSGSCVRTGVFDDTNGLFWEYDGQELYVVRRSSTFQLVGTVQVTSGSGICIGTGTKFNDQLKVGDNIQIRGQKYTVTGVKNNTTITINPSYRGESVSNIKPTIIRELRIPRSKFNTDKLNGRGPSGYNIDLLTMQMMAIQYSWYGAGFVDFMCRGPLGEFITAHRMPNNNINSEAYMRSGNLPARYEVSNISANSQLTVNTGAAGTSVLNLEDASAFPTGVGIATGYVLLRTNVDGTVFTEVMSYTGKSGNQLTGITTATSYTQYLAGSNRTFSGITTTTLDHPVGSNVFLLNSTCSPTISHWGSAVIIDGNFDDDTGYLFNISNVNITIDGGATKNILLFRPAPSVSDTIPGLLGQREILNRSQINFKELQVNIIAQGGSNTSRNVEIAGILNGSNVSGATWTNASSTSVGSAIVYQPSFAQYYAPPNATPFAVPTDGEILFRYIAVEGSSTFDLSQIKEVQNSILGGNNTYPDGPEVLSIIIANRNSNSITADISLKWTEAQA
jgi:hypothetical protein